jgi:hypothetical protein
MVKLPNVRAGKGWLDADRPDEQLAALLTQVRNAYRAAGEPSYREISTLSGRRLSPSTISRLFRTTKPPKWRNLAMLLNALGVQPNDLVTKWHPLWAKAQNTVEPIAPPDTTLRLAEQQTDRTCGDCGAVVGDAKIHSDWHRRLGLAANTVQMLQRNSIRAVSAPNGRAPTSRMPGGGAGLAGPGTGR